jgi:hypothetical protein
VHPGESLLNTFPGRLFINELRWRGGSPAVMSAQDLLEAATHAVASYLYNDSCLEVVHLDVDDPELRKFDSAALAALSKLSTFGSPQIHQGMLEELRAPRVGNRDPLNGLPHGAFWTSTPLADDVDSWTISGENLHRDRPRWEVHFDATHVRVARVDSAREWIDLIDSAPVTTDGCKYPDWPAIARSWDAVHLSPLGLLLAHPKISTTPFVSTDGSGLAHSKAGPYASVGDWSAVSTAWLHKPPGVRIRPAAAY